MSQLHRSRILPAYALLCALLGASAQAQDASTISDAVDAGVVAPADDAAIPEEAAATPSAADAPSEPVAPLPEAPSRDLPSEDVVAPPPTPAAELTVQLPPEAAALAPEPEQTTFDTPALEVTVVGTKLSRTAGSAHVIGKKQLERFEYDDPHRVLLSVPGVYIRGEDGMGLRNNISIRGVDPDRSKKITLLEDGILFAPSPYTAPADYYFPVMTRMEKVRVIKGPGTISYGPQTVGGTIDLVTRSIPTTTTGGADVAAGQYGYGKAHVHFGTSTEQVGFLIEGVRLQNNGFKELPDGRDTGLVRNEWMIKSSYVIDPTASVRNEFRLKLTYSDEVSNESYLGLTDADFRRNPDRRYEASELDRMQNHRISGVLTHQVDFNPKLSLTTNLYRHQFNRTWRKVNGFRDSNVLNVLRSPQDAANQERYRALQGTDFASDPILIGPNQRDFISQGIESRLRWDRDRRGFAHRLEVGARYHYDTIDRRHSQDQFIIQNGQLTPTTEPTEVWEYNKAATHAVALHAIYAGTWRGLTITPGVRSELMYSYEKDRLSGERIDNFLGVVVPGVGAFYAITENIGVLAGAYGGFSPPSPGTEQKPEKSVNYEYGARYTRGASRLEAIGYFNDYSNLTVLCTASQSCGQNDMDKQSSLGRAAIYGVEVGGEHELAVGAFRLPLQLAYTLTKTEVRDEIDSPVEPYDGGKPGDQLPFIPLNQLRVGAGLEHARAGLNASFTYVQRAREKVGKQDLSDVSPQDVLRTGTQYILDLGAFAKVWKTISVYATLQNVLDYRYIASHRPFGARPNTPRWLQVGVKGSF